MRSARSGSSLSVKMPRLVRGMSPNAMVDTSDRYRPSATLMGSTSPMRSAMVMSGVASFSPYRRSRGSQSMGVSSPSAAIRSRVASRMGASGSSLSSEPATTGHGLIEQVDQGPGEACLGLATLAQQHEVLARQDGVLDGRDDALAVAHDAREHRLVRGERAPGGWRAAPP